MNQHTTGDNNENNRMHDESVEDNANQRSNAGEAGNNNNQDDSNFYDNELMALKQEFHDLRYNSSAFRLKDLRRVGCTRKAIALILLSRLDFLDVFFSLNRNSGWHRYIPTLLKAIRQSSHLTGIQISGRSAQNATIDASLVKALLLDGVRRSKSIQVLELRLCMIDWYDLRLTLPNIVKLSLDNVCTSAGTPGIGLSGATLLGNILREASQLKGLGLRSCGLRAEHIRVLSDALGKHPSLEKLDFDCNELGDEGISAFVEHWDQKSIIEDLSVCDNNIGPIGAKLLIKSVAKQSRMRVLCLDYNSGIGYEGVKIIGVELPTTRLRELSLRGVVEWTRFSDPTCDAAVEQKNGCIEVGRALLEGIRENIHLEVLWANFRHFPKAEIGFYTEANENHRRLLMWQYKLPLAFWSHFFSKPTWNTSSFMFLMLRELEVLMTRRERRGETPPRKKQRTCY